MPQIQTIDFTPPKRTETTPFEKFLSSFGEATVKRQEENQDIEGLLNVYKRHKETGAKIEDTIQNIFTEPGLSPTARVNAANQMFKMAEFNQKKQHDADVLAVRKLEAEARSAKAGGLSTEIPEEWRGAIANTVLNNPGVSAEILQAKFDEQGIPRKWTDFYSKNRQASEKTGREAEADIKVGAAKSANKIAEDKPFVDLKGVELADKRNDVAGRLAVAKQKLNDAKDAGDKDRAQELNIELKNLSQDLDVLDKRFKQETSERKESETFKKNERTGTQEFKKEERLGEQEFKKNERLGTQEYKTGAETTKNERANNLLTSQGKALGEAISAPEADLMTKINSVLKTGATQQQKNTAINGLINATNALNPKTESGAAPPPEMANKIRDIVRDNRDMDADDLAIEFDLQEIPRKFANSYIENRRRQDETEAKNLVAEGKGTEKKLHEYHKESSKYDEKVRESASRAVKQLDAVEDLRDAVKSGNVKPLSFSNIFKRMGTIGEKISNAFTNADQGKFDAAMPLLLEGWKDVFGVRLSDADIKILENKLPGIGKSPEANKAILDIIDKYSRPNIVRAQVAKEIKAQNKGLRPLNFAEKVEEETNKRMENSKPVILKDPNGVKRRVPRSDVEKLLKEKWTK